MNELTVGTSVCVDLIDRTMCGVVERIEIQTPGCLWVEVTCKGHTQIFPMEDFKWHEERCMWTINSFRGWYTYRPLHFMSFRK